MTDTDRTGGPDEFPVEARRVANLVPNCAIYVLDRDGYVAVWSEAASRLTGYPQSDAVGIHYEQFFPDPVREEDRAEQLLSEAAADEQVRTEGWRRKRDGSLYRAREVLAVVRDGDSAAANGYVVVTHDVTVEHEQADALRTEKAVVESILDAQPDILYAFDRDDTLLHWNDRLETVTGYDPDDLADMGPLAFVAPEDRDRIGEAIDRILEAGDRVALEGTLLTAAGERLPYEFNSAPIVDEHGTVLGFTGVGRDVSDRRARERELREERAFTESVFAAQPDIVYAFDADGTFRKWNEQVPAVTGYSDAELAEMEPDEFVPPEDRDRIGEAIDRILEAGEQTTAEAELLTKDGTRIPYEFSGARMRAEDGTVLGFTGVGRDVSDRKARERELERIDQLNGVIRAINDELVSVETRRELERAIVEAFVTVDSIAGAVVGTYDAPDGFDPRVQAGGDVPADAGLLPEPAEASAVDPADIAGERERVATRRHLQEDPIDEWRAVADEDGYRAVVAVPFVAERRLVGMLGLYASVPDAFDDREREILQEFGGTIGHAINAMAVRRLLYADTVVELEFEATDRGDVCIDLSREGDCRLSIDHLLPLTDEVFVYYLTASGIDADRFRDLATARPEIGELRRIDGDPTAHRWEVEIHGSTIAAFLTEYGARVRSQEIDGGVATLVVEASPDTAVRELTDAFQSTYPETTLVAKRTVERPLDAGGDFGSAIDPDLTEKQRTALEAAYYGGYFEWPSRQSDAGDVADRLGIARQTFHQHLRVAEAKLLEAYLEDGT
ncbi:PAS domain S-box protein [Halosolutus amylolyticus]|uniref:PAS domain S-box protein n=1 Tax=Halosolutus amylolyticus TaxID=2932267 RepID=A0ABD5PUG5_9EURY|nr:PAS domain S-box protein [Halosolutus amylolyticus]